MTHTRRRALTAFRRLADDVGGHYRIVAAENGYRVTGLEPGDVDYVDTEWDGSDAEASYPNPTADDTDLDFLSDHYLFPPASMSDDDPPSKSAFKGPIRQGPGGPVNTQALLANIQAINGARGGFDGIDAETLRSGFDAAVAHLVAAGEYESADDAPDPEVEAARVTADAHFSTGDVVRWEDGDADVYGIIRDKATSGEDVFADRIDGDFSLSPTEDDPGYLVETLDETDDAWVPSDTMTGHRGSTLQEWSPDKDVADSDASASRRRPETDTVQFTLTAADGSDDGLTPLTGIIWGAGDHDLGLGGRPTPVHVPPETVRPTFDALQEDIEAGDVTLGFDHPGPDSVAAQTGIVDIGTADDVALADDGDHIVLTDSTLENDQAVQAAQDGDFDDLDWSVVADVAVRRDDNGDPVTNGDDRVVLDATRIKRIDAVETGAVDAASIERGTDPLPDLSTEADTVRQAASAAPTPNHTTDAVSALRASSTALHDTMGKTPQFDPNVDDDDIPEAVAEQLTAAADIIDNQKERLQAAEAKADGLTKLLTAHDVDLEDFDSPEAAAQAVIDEQTEDIRREIADLEADLAAYDTDDVEARASELAGRDATDLRNTLNARKAEAYDRERKRQTKGRAAAKGDTTGRTDLAGGSTSGGSADADEVALKAMDGRDRIEADAAGLSPSEYVKREYGIHASEYDAADALNADIIEAMNGGE